MTYKPRSIDFWDYMEHTESGCWVWRGHHMASGGYGQVRIHGVLHRTHRLAYELTYGPIPTGMIVCHRCDNPPCCNPEHLFLGTHRDNSDDKVAKGRARNGRFFGENNHLSKLTAADVQSIRATYAAGGVCQRTLAQQYGVNQQVIWSVVNRRTWKEVPDVCP